MGKAGADATFGYAKSDGPILAAGYENDVTREKAAFDVSAKIIESQGKNIESKTWWLARDNLRGQAYNMKANMQALNKVSKDPGRVQGVHQVLERDQPARPGLHEEGARP